MKYGPLFFSLVLTSIGFVFPWCIGTSAAEIPGQGTLTIVEPDGKPGAGCPLEHTSVKAEVSEFISRVSVVQRFHNPGQEKIEAIYTFPLPNDAAVNEMLMRVGDRLVRGEIKKREEARQIYQQARDRGHVASLLDPGNNACGDSAFSGRKREIPFSRGRNSGSPRKGVAEPKSIQTGYACTSYEEARGNAAIRYG